MARKPATATTTPVVPAPVSPAPVATAAPAQPVDPFAGLVVYAPTAFVRPAAPVSPHVLAFANHLAANGSGVIIIEGWDDNKLKLFRKQLTRSPQTKAIVGGRRFLIRAGTSTDNKPALSVSLSKPPTNGNGQAAA